MPPNESDGVLDDLALQDTEALSCVTCRARKLKCNRAKPACARCVKVRGDCIYPESRRKPAFKRKNVKELEARLAQVEVLLRDVGTNPPAPAPKRPGATAAAADGAGLGLDAPDPDGTFDFSEMEMPDSVNLLFDGLDYPLPLSWSSAAPNPPHAPPGRPGADAAAAAAAADDDDPAGFRCFGGELMGLGMSEPPPPFKVMEELNRIFFQRQQHFIPVVNPQRYYQAFYSGSPHMKPPMCLQYAMFAMAAHLCDEYASSHGIFYNRARQYAEADEMKGSGEHFLTVAHAQAWCCIAVYEAKNMMFTRAAMSTARAVRLVEMMGLHRLDSPPGEISPTLLPPKDWAELEERRRTFWGVFCIESHCSISTGWPSHINALEVTTHLPAPESAFVTGQGVATCTLSEALQGHTYHSFAGAVLVCHFFNEIIKHNHRARPNDRPDNYEHGEFWKRHRELDNALSSAFMFLPESFRLPDHYRDMAALHSNLNLHACVICLHHAAIDKADTHKLPDTVKRASQSRLLTAANEIVNIAKMISHLKANPKRPMAGLAVYCAATVYVYQCRETKSARHADDLDFCVAALHAFSREHAMTRSFLRQLVLDVERNGVDAVAHLPALASLPPELARGPHAIPLLARSAVSRHEAVPPPLPGRLPLGDPQGARTGCTALTDCGVAGHGRIREIEHDAAAPGSDASAGRHKRRRRSVDTSPLDSNDSPARWAYPAGGGGHVLSTDPSESTVSSRSTPPESQDASYHDPPPPASFPPSAFAHDLPHRTNSPSAAGVLFGDVRLPLPGMAGPGGLYADTAPTAPGVATVWDFLGTTASATTVDWNAIYTASSGFDPGSPVAGAEGGAAAATR